MRDRQMMNDNREMTDANSHEIVQFAGSGNKPLSHCIQRF
jgi:hypothetical protein